MILKILVKSNSKNYRFVVPNEIEYCSEKLKVTSIQNFECQDNIWIYFRNDSPIKTIRRGSLNSSKVKQITVPSTVEEIEEGFSTYRSDIRFEVNNIKYKEKYVLNAACAIAIKSEPMLDYYDILLTPGNKVNYQEVSCFIKRIASYSFFFNDLQSLYFRPNSTLESIGQLAFYQCKLKKINFPSSLIRIEKEAFRCTHLKSIQFSHHSKLKELEDFAFSQCDLTEVTLPASLVKMGYGYFSYNDLKYVNLNTDLNWKKSVVIHSVSRN